MRVTRFAPGTTRISGTIAQSMVIRSDQMGTLADSSRSRANSELAAYARRRFPTRFADTQEEVLLKIADEVRTRAAAEGFEREDHVSTFLDLTVMYGSNFPQSDWAAPVLSNASLDAERKMLSLTNQVEQSGVKL
jgi:hypothetical protein